MTQETARKVADGILVAGAVVAAYYVIKTPRLRRMAWGLAAHALTGTLPVWFSTEVRQAWAASGRRAI
jgi:hypothetical protein